MPSFFTPGYRLTSNAIYFAGVVLLAAQVKGQTQGGTPYGLDPNFIRDPFYNPSSNQFNPNSPYPDPSLFPTQYRQITPPSQPRNYNYNQSPQNYQNYNSNPSQNQYQYNQNQYQYPNSGSYYDQYQYQYQPVTLNPPVVAPPATIPPPVLAPEPPKTAEVDDSSKGSTGLGESGPVFNPNLFPPRPQAQRAWPYGQGDGHYTGSVFGAGRLYSLPTGTGRNGLLERTFGVLHRRRQQQYRRRYRQQHGYGNFNNPLLWAAFGGW